MRESGISLSWWPSRKGIWLQGNRLLPECLYIPVKEPRNNVPSMTNIKASRELALAWQSGPVLSLCSCPGLPKQLPRPDIPFPASGASRLSH